ncbi:MAG: TatD family hydrolase [Methanobacteriota archaeon]
MIIDVHLGMRHPATDERVKETLGQMDSANIDKAVTWSLPIGTDREVFQKNNDRISSVVEKYPNRFIGFAVVNPLDPDFALDELGRAIEQLGLSGLKLHPKVHQYRICDPRTLKVVELARDLNIPVVIHVESIALYNFCVNNSREKTQQIIDHNEFFAKSLDLDAVIKVYDSENFWAAHMGGITHPSIQKSNLAFQTTGASSEIIEYAVSKVGADRILFGSDYPSYQVKEEIAKLNNANISESDKRKILSDNAARILKIK